MIKSYSHRGLRRAHHSGSYHQVNAVYANRIARVIATLQAATRPSDLDLPGYRLHPLKGNLEGFWSIRISANWRITFRMEGVHVYDVDLTDYHWERTPMPMMKDPPHPGGTVKEDCIEAEGLTVTEAARLLGVTRPTLSRVINGRGGISPEMAIRFEKIGWSNAEFWMRLQTNYDLAQARLSEDRINVEPYQPAAAAS